MGKKRKSMPVTFGAPVSQKLKTSSTALPATTTKASPTTSTASNLERAFAQLTTDPLGLLVGGENTASFLENQWEQAPCVFRASPERLAYFHHLLSLSSYLQAAKKRDEPRRVKSADKMPASRSFRLGVDVNAARYVRGHRETLNEINAEQAKRTDLTAVHHRQATAATLSLLHDTKGCTLQVLQPQRWDDRCWRLAAALEAQFGCLVGVNAYLTPGGTQGLAPHCDPVEIFVIQTENKKSWRLYEPLEGFALPNQASGDLRQDQIGKPCMEVVLSPGDVLYMPRGTIHQAVAGEGGKEGRTAVASSHLTISTYQQWSYGDLATQMMEVVGHNVTYKTSPATFPLPMRRSPLPGFIFEHSLARPPSPPASVTALAAGLRALAAHIEKNPKLVSLGTWSLCMDFLGARLPPHPATLLPPGPMPERLMDGIKLRVGKGCAYLLPYTVREVKLGMEGEEGEEGEGGGMMKLVHCLDNSRWLHMMGAEEEEEDGEAEEEEEEEEEDDDESEDDEDETGEEEEEEAVMKWKGNEEEGKEHMRSEEGQEEEEDEGEKQEEEEGGEEEEEEEEEASPAVGMSPLDAIPGIIFPAKFRLAVSALLGHGGGGEGGEESRTIKIKDLPGLSNDADKMELAVALWQEGLVATVRKKKKGVERRMKGALGDVLVARHGEGGQLPSVAKKVRY
ncbi:hypothetical protein VYU27_007030 [Nannochloropsis oceanica]